jgi:hypothetical protein
VAAFILNYDDLVDARYLGDCDRQEFEESPSIDGSKEGRAAKIVVIKVNFILLWWWFDLLQLVEL